MKRFKFRLAVPLELRRLAEREALQRLAAALQAHAAIENEMASLKRRRDEAFAALTPVAGARLDVSELLQAHDHLRAMDLALERLRAREARAAADLETARVDVGLKARERKALERLEDRARKEWKEEGLREEARLMDEIASLRHGRREEEGVTP